MSRDFEFGQNHGVIGEMFLLSDFDEIRYVCRDRWGMHNVMTFGPIRGQSQGHGALEVEILAIFKVYLLRHLSCELANDYWFLN